MLVWVIWTEKEANQLDNGPTIVTLPFVHTYDNDLEVKV